MTQPKKTLEQSKCERRMDIRKTLLVKSLRELVTITGCLSHNNKCKLQITDKIRTGKKKR